MTIENPQNTGEGRIDSIPENPMRMSLARAMATRSFDEQQRNQMRIAKLTNSKYQPPSPLVRDVFILVGTQLNDKILTDQSALPTDPQTLTATMFASLSDDVFDEMIRDAQKDEVEPITMTGSQLRSFCRVMVESVTSLVPTSTTGGGFTSTLRQIDEARKIGAERGKDPIAVYVNDELYAELIRRSKTPSEIAKRGIQMARQFTPDKITEMIMNMMSESARIMNETAEDESEIVDQEDIEEMKQEMTKDPEFKKGVRKMTLQYKRALKTLVAEEIVRFWGQEGLDSLPKSAREAIIRSTKLVYRTASLNTL